MGGKQEKWFYPKKKQVEHPYKNQDVNAINWKLAIWGKRNDFDDCNKLGVKVCVIVPKSYSLLCGKKGKKGLKNRWRREFDLRSLDLQLIE